jgi:tetratricopeptide (TPR) repeat protein
VHFAHEAGIIHRDLKPANILLDEHGAAHVTDFGIAKDLNASALTATGTVIGTYEYMSPEQADPNRERVVDRRTDVYALGAILYRILTGRPPFEGPPISIVKHVLLDPPAPPRSGAPLALETACLRALEKDPARRQQTAEDFARELELALKESAPPSKRSSIAGLVAVALPLAIAAGVMGYVGGDRTRASSDANAELRIAWARAEALLRSGVPLDDAALRELSDLSARASGDEARDSQKALPFARARSRLLASAEPDLDALPREGPERELLDAEIATLGRNGKTPDDAWKLLERTNTLRPSWRADAASERWTALARRFVAVGKPGLAASALLAAAELASREGAGPDQAASLIDQAVELDLAAVTQHPGNAPALLAEVAVQALSEKNPSPHAVTVARRRLYRARLLDPALPLDRARPFIVALGSSPSVAMRLAARPWAGLVENLSEIEKVLDAPLKPDETARMVMVNPKTWPPGWSMLIAKGEELSKERGHSWLAYECFGECALWRPDVPLIWLHLGVAATNQYANAEARRCLEIGLTRSTDSQLTYYLGRLDMDEQRFEDAVDHLKRSADDSARRKLESKWASYYLAESLVKLSKRPEAETVLREIERDMSDHRSYWLLRADLAAGRTEEATYRASAQKARFP